MPSEKLTARNGQQQHRQRLHQAEDSQQQRRLFRIVVQSHQIEANRDKLDPPRKRNQEPTAGILPVIGVLPEGVGIGLGSDVRHFVAPF
jgi:hypothetical protein